MTLTEALVAAAIGTVVSGALFSMAGPLQSTFDGQLELADMQQRARAGVYAMEHDLRAAGPPVMPYRAGATRHDPASGVFYRSDTITVVSRSWDGVVTSNTYYLRQTAGASQLVHYDGVVTDFPVVDHVVALAFEYFTGTGDVLPAAALQDGPWVPHDGVADPIDADLATIRRVQVTLRVEAARDAFRGPAGALFARGGTARSMDRYLPDRVIRFDVAPRNLGDE